MTDYSELDRLIVEAIKAGGFYWCAGSYWKEAWRIANATGREAYRIIDGRLLALRKAGKIKYLKASAGSKARWVVVEGEMEGGEQ